MTHLDSLKLMLSNERIRLSNAKTPEEIELRSVYVKQLEKEIDGEIKFMSEIHMNDDDILIELFN